MAKQEPITQEGLYRDLFKSYEAQLGAQNNVAALMLQSAQKQKQIDAQRQGIAQEHYNAIKNLPVSTPLNFGAIPEVQDIDFTQYQQTPERVPTMTGAIDTARLPMMNPQTMMAYISAVQGSENNRYQQNQDYQNAKQQSSAFNLGLLKHNQAQSENKANRALTMQQLMQYQQDKSADREEKLLELQYKIKEIEAQTALGSVDRDTKYAEAKAAMAENNFGKLNTMFGVATLQDNQRLTADKTYIDYTSDALTAGVKPSDQVVQMFGKTPNGKPRTFLPDESVTLSKTYNDIVAPLNAIGITVDVKDLYPKVDLEYTKGKDILQPPAKQYVDSISSKIDARQKEVIEEMQGIGTLSTGAQQQALQKALLLNRILSNAKRSLPRSREDINASTKNDPVVPADAAPGTFQAPGPVKDSTFAGLRQRGL